MTAFTATYRVQLNAGFTLAQARDIVSYLATLGVSHLYLSPVLAARKGSMHGYDVVDPARVNPEIGNEEDLRALADELHRRGMGLILDIVPNHMSTGDQNGYWDDVLAHGEGARYAHWFDIDWHGRRGRPRVVLPVLGDELDAVVDRGEISVRVTESDGARFVYFNNTFPIDPKTRPPELQLAQWDPAGLSAVAERFAGDAGKARIRALLDAQNYRLVFWKRGAAEINYRRFFDINDLIALRMEDPAVFDETHALVLRWVNEGIVDGLRIDHIDGLKDPLAYLRRLRERVGQATPVFVEKILSSDERLRETWPVQGTTGYELLNALEDVFIHPAGYAEIEREYRRTRRLADQSFESIARNAKRAVLKGALRSDVNRLARLLVPIANTAARGETPRELAVAIVELIASLRVYRTYIRPGGAVEGQDRVEIERARDDAARAAPSSAEAIRFVAAVLVGEVPSDGEFTLRFQQTSGPAAAKGVEDTALYVYVPLVSRNEVGGSPERSLEDAVRRLHDANARRAARWPHSLICTNTHDTKRSADLRARLDVLSEMPADWDRVVRRWRRLNAKRRTLVKGRFSPDSNTEYLVYQTLVGMWPGEDVRRRIEQYGLKAAREAKTETNWTEPDSAYELALRRFLDAITYAGANNEFLADVGRVVSRIAKAGAVNSLSRILLHLTAPGTPDIYQGDELWNFALVDPDNRRPVDYTRRRQLLAALDRLPDVVDPASDETKLFVTHRILAARGAKPDLFAKGDYRPLVVSGPAADHTIAFARSHGRDLIVVVAPRLASTAEHAERTERWEGSVQLPATAALGVLGSVFTGEAVAVQEGRLQLSKLFNRLPLGFLATDISPAC